ncbi:Minor endoglucanase Y precursor [Cedecea davisae]|uniref:Glucanase n=1 Tax=Cedecea davisae DSM 4568 TaxID=566551 RepID=S3JIF7_9ENTR|nr:glycosyl hydrolase family 8 [Cedecea davisae]EPF12989.1 minor endoglucanase Y [Cedecea davisae DSM 4568]SUX37171.1 Minor endoglucanase Y precursor [Cedecea davisae]
MVNRLITLLLTGMVWLMASLPAKAAAEWDSYKSRFLMADGRIIDTGNNNVSHTEGQGFAMMMAVSNDDRASFDKIWNWTNATLRNPKNGLFYWRYNPVEADPIADKNNATDGDTFIAWALLKAGQKWHDSGYLKESDAIAKALVTHNVIQFADKRVMLPGVNGFNLNSSVTLNPSYFIFPAWQDFAQRSHLVVWKELITDGKTLLDKMRWGNSQLPTDWVSLAADGKLTPDANHPPRFSYDAIRVPLYLAWQDPASPELAPFKSFWSRYPRAQTPAWINVANNQTAPYMMTGGLLAVRDLALGDTSQPPHIIPQDDYYSASLKMLVLLAKQ